MSEFHKIKHKYCGVIDENGFISKQGCYEWKSPKFVQKYTGQFLNNNLHYNGTYTIDSKGKKVYYSGLFYANKLEGYSQVIYRDGTIFEGLFKQHNRFGPGILTHQNNTQDVGLWNGSHLIKLSQPITDNLNIILRLGVTPQGSARLLKYRSLIPVKTAKIDRAKDILMELNASDEILSQSDKLYDNQARDIKSLFFNVHLYDENFIMDDSIIEIELTQEEFEEELRCYNSDNNITLNYNKDNNCKCFRVMHDKFTQLCVEMDSIEKQLERIIASKTKLESKLDECRLCCALNCIYSDDKSKQNDINRESDAIINIYRKRSSMSDSKSQLYQSEDEIQSFYYTEIDEKDANSDLAVPNNNGVKSSSDNNIATSSIVTLPFELQKSSENQNIGHLLTPRNGLVVSSAEQKFISNQSIERKADSKENNSNNKKTCECSRLKIDNINILLKKLSEINQDEIFYTTIKRCLKRKLDIEYCKMQELSKNNKYFTKKIAVTDLLAWNNEEIFIQIQRHCFHRRRSEDYVDFNVADLLASRRDKFKKRGEYESLCCSFLQCCLNGKAHNAFLMLSQYNIDINLCDSRGNTGIMLASCGDNFEMIEMLACNGGCLDSVNDEGLTPLIMALLRYIAVFLRVNNNWEKAFLQETKFNQEDLIKMQNLSEVVRIPSNDDNNNNNKCLAKLDSNNDEYEYEEKGEEGDNYREIEIDEEQKYMLNIDYVAKKVEKKKKKKKKRKKNKTKSTKHKKKSHRKGVKQKSEPVTITIDPEAVIINDKLSTIRATISKLLLLGANANIGEVPMKSLHLAVFSDSSDIFIELLSRGADPNMMIINDNLTPLHIIASVIPTEEKLKMCLNLARYGADLNRKTSSAHWSELKSEIIGNILLNNDDNSAKTALHILSLREDSVGNRYVNDLVEILVFNGCNPDEIYMGHTALSLAVLKGNLGLIECLLNTKWVNPYYNLGYNMGNAFTILVLKRFSFIMQDINQREIVDLFIRNRFNPLHQVDEFENIIEFIENEKNIQVITNKKEKKKHNKNKKSVERKKHKTPKIEDYITEISREILFRNIQSRAVEYLYILITENIFNHPLIDNWIKLLNIDVALKCLEALFQYGVIEEERFNYSVIYDLIELIKSRQHPEKLEDSSEKIELENRVKNIKFLSYKNEAELYKIYLPPIEVDRDNIKYEICFQCLRSNSRKLQLCPKCELIYFCSESCNLLNNKSSKYHKCNILFYDPINNNNSNNNMQKNLTTRNLLDFALLLKQEREALFKLNIISEKLSQMKFKPNLMLKKYEKMKSCVENITKRRKLHYRNLQINSLCDIQDCTTEITNITDNSLSRRDIIIAGASMKTLKTTEICSSQLKTSHNSNNNNNNAKHLRIKSFELSKKRSVIEKNNNDNEAADSKLNEAALNHNKSFTKEYYLELLSKIFADFNLPLVLLPYACFKDGQVYYSMSDNAYMGKNFQKLLIPK